VTRARFLPEAEAEFDEAVQFYERAEGGLGSAFTLEVERTVERIRAFPSPEPSSAHQAAGGSQPTFRSG
jgi:hypothetical protein